MHNKISGRGTLTSILEQKSRKIILCTKKKMYQKKKSLRMYFIGTRIKEYYMAKVSKIRKH
ncbi:MAG: hypothetical protein PHD97_11505 [Bacteroidales bacterium]|nr:hypothetical protein [Bacteroidales bacterium]